MVLYRSRELECYDFVGLPEDAAPLGMPDDHVATTHIHQHRRGNTAGIGAAVEPTDVLRSKTDIGVPEHMLRLGKIRIRHAYRILGSVHRSECRDDRLQ